MPGPGPGSAAEPIRAPGIEEGVSSGGRVLSGDRNVAGAGAVYLK